MNRKDLMVLVHNAFHAGSSVVTIPGKNRQLPIGEYPFSGVRFVIVPDTVGVRHEFMTQNPNEASFAGSLAKQCNVAITRERILIGNTRNGVLTNAGVIDGNFTFRIDEAIQRDLESRTLVA